MSESKPTVQCDRRVGTGVDSSAYIRPRFWQSLLRQGLRAVWLPGLLLGCFVHGWEGNATASTRVQVEAITPHGHGVEVRLSGRASYKWKALPGKPAQGVLDRCYVNISPASIDRHVPRFLDSAHGAIQHIRLAQFSPSIVRLVLDLRAPEECRVFAHATTDHLLVTVGQAAIPEGYQRSALSSPSRSTSPLARAEPQAATPIKTAVAARPPAPSQPLSPQTNRLSGVSVSQPTRAESPPPEQPTTPAPQLIEAIEAAPKETERSEEPAASTQQDLPTAADIIWQPVSQVWAMGGQEQSEQGHVPDSRGVSAAAVTSEPPADEKALAEMREHAEDALLVSSAESIKESPPQEISPSPSQTDAEKQDRGNQKKTREMGPSPSTVVEETMHIAWAIAVSVGCILAFLAGGGAVWWFLTHKNRGNGEDSEESGDLGVPVAEHVAKLEGLLEQAGLTNNDLFEALEHKQKQLELLLTRADWVSQDLRRLLTQVSAGERREGRQTDPYTTAALLLTEGEAVEDIAQTLKLPVAQVRLVQALKQEVRQQQGFDWAGASATQAGLSKKTDREKTTPPFVPTAGQAAISSQSDGSDPSPLFPPPVQTTPDPGTHIAARGQGL